MTSWFPIGPDFVFGPRDSGFVRLTRRNEYGRQCSIYDFAIDPTDSNRIYAVTRPWVNSDSPYQANALYRSTDGGLTWESIGDSLHQTNPLIDFRSVVVDPVAPNIIYVGTSWNGGIYISTSRGDPGSWLPARSVSDHLEKIVLDPRTAGDPSTAVLYVGGEYGLYQVPPSGPPVTLVSGRVPQDLAFHFPTSGSPRCFAGVQSTGLYFSSDPATPSSWVNLSDDLHGLPKNSTTPFYTLAPAICRQNPERVYAWLLGNNSFIGLYQLTASDPTTASWSPITITTPPTIFDGPGFLFDIAPNSIGDTNDILFVAGVNMWRSKDAGQNWYKAHWYYSDHHHIGFVPENPTGGTIPVTFYSCDGGMASSTGLCDPGYDVLTTPDYGDGPAPTAESAKEVVNLDHGLHATAIYGYACDPGAGVIGYIGNQDTGTAASSGTLGWRAMGSGDISALACVRSSGGMVVWNGGGFYGGFPGWATKVFTDTGDIEGLTSSSFASYLGATLGMASSYVVGADSNCYAGCDYWDLGKTLMTSITTPSSSPQSATASSASGIDVGRTLLIDGEQVTILSATGASFTAVFSQPHSSGAPLRARFHYVFRIDHAAAGTPLSQDFSLSHDHVTLTATHPSSLTTLVCVTYDNRLWITDGTTAAPGTTWSEIPLGLPAGTPPIVSLAVDAAGAIYLVLSAPVTIGGTTGALIIVSGGVAQLQTSASLPSTYPYGRLVIDPVAASTLYVVHGGGVFQLTPSGTPHDWSAVDLSPGLPGAWIGDLWVGNVGTAASPHVLLRAAIPARSVWEREVTAGASDPPSGIDLYFRKHLLDDGRQVPPPDGVTNPYHPSEQLWHYQSPDIKVDSQQSPPGLLPFFQATPPIDHTLFDQLKDNSEALPPGDLAWVHVQVHNRSNAAAGNLWVWALYTHFAAGLPHLDATWSSAPFDFWGQFSSAGTITSTLTADNKWQPVGAPQPISSLDALHPQVVSWPWTVPTLVAGDSGHYCVVAFVHGAGAAQILTTGTDVDVITPLTKQIGQKNLQLIIGQAGQIGQISVGDRVWFNNPTPEPRVATLAFDLRTLPRQIRVEISHATLKTLRPIEQSFVAATPSAFDASTWTLKSSSLALIEDVVIPAHGTVALRFGVRVMGALPPGSEWRFHVQQLVDKRMVGGAAVAIRIPGARRPPKLSLAVEPDEAESDDDNSRRLLPPTLFSAR